MMHELRKLYIDYNSIFRPSKEIIHRNKKAMDNIEQNVQIRRLENGFEAKIKDLDLSFIDKMKE